MKRFVSSRCSGMILAAVGIAMMGYGIYRGELSVIFAKAVQVCMECIGIG